METSSAAGYSGTPLFKKLGIKEAHRVLPLDAPKEYESLLAPLPPAVMFVTRPDSKVDIAHAFVTQREELAKVLSLLRRKLKPDAALWISWPKKSSKVPTTITEDTIRELALPLGFVDIKVCAVTEVWSGLKLVVRKELR
ncbi:DUF3052 domain-containing protein [Paucibacter sp. XJ19-41]|uniref:DUF3052 domain-containing protein n=1 Tax=Paucibacter sp. XJ19-41 TaxID=2927824 RepID=UPI00234B5B77|nr:DUF3052 domain-containing protein [Paucibacter sp. XJ19-41]MDC6171168.1 DUF3052 domain-containing protein [Paucibacter sp. XJ19-41]